jgi:hypothetical protein
LHRLFALTRVGCHRKRLDQISGKPRIKPRRPKIGWTPRPTRRAGEAARNFLAAATLGITCAAT